MSDALINSFSESDEFFMELALDEAQKAKLISPPNPSVGAVIVKDGVIIAKGFTQKVGGPHAEIMALRNAAENNLSVVGATIYVTLEPCAHYGRTPPCALALVNAGISRVVVAILDPNPLVAGKGVKILQDASIRVDVGLGEKRASEINKSFLKAMKTGFPWVRLKVATTLDGRVAFLDGQSKWITGQAARKDTHWLRANSQAVITGIGTILSDDPQMNVRLDGCDSKPIRVVVDKHLDTPITAKILNSDGGKVIFVTSVPHEGKAKILESKGAVVWHMPKKDNPQKVDLSQMLKKLLSIGVIECHLEAGPGLNGGFLGENLVDEIVQYISPCYFGQGLAVAKLQRPQTPGQAKRWTVYDLENLNNDIKLTLRRG